MDANQATALTPDLASHAVQRGIGELRRGAPIRLTGRESAAVLAMETAGLQALHWFESWTGPAPLLVFAAERARALGLPESAAAAAAIAAEWRDPAALLALADPSRPEPAPVALSPAPLPPGHDAALALAKAARLLPCVLMAPAAPSPVWLDVPADAARAWPGSQAARLEKSAAAHVPIAPARDARVVAFRPEDGGVEHVAVLIGAPEQARAPLLRIHSECFTGDVLGSLRCDCGPQLRAALGLLAEGDGVLLYLSQEGRGIGLVNKLRAYALQDRGLDTLDANLALGWGADERSMAPAAAMLRSLGIGRVRLLTNNPAKMAGLEAAGIAVEARVALRMAPNGVDDAYLETKRRRFGHLL